MIDKKRILIKVKNFLTEYFPHAYGAMITGSFLTEKFNSNRIRISLCRTAKRNPLTQIGH